MTFFVDANPIVYSATGGAAAANCLRVLEAVAAGEADGRTSPAVLEEVWHVAERHYRGRLEGLAPNALAVFSPLLPVTEQALVHALGLEAPSLGPNDRLHLGTCAAEGIEVVLSADRGFDGIGAIERVDPFDPGAVDRLLAA